MKGRSTTYINKTRVRVAVLGIIISCIAASVIVSLLAKHFAVNATSSMPLGIYRIVSKPVERGSIVGACIPESFATLSKERGYLGRGVCPNQVRPVMKYVAAVAGDSVEVSLNGVSVNGKKIPNTKILLVDQLNRVVPSQIGKHSVAVGEYWLISNSNQGCFDSRYFGSVKEILGVVEPFITKSQLCRLSFARLLVSCERRSENGRDAKY